MAGKKKATLDVWKGKEVIILTDVFTDDQTALEVSGLLVAWDENDIFINDYNTDPQTVSLTINRKHCIMIRLAEEVSLEEEVTVN